MGQLEDGQALQPRCSPDRCLVPGGDRERSWPPRDRMRENGKGRAGSVLGATVLNRLDKDGESATVIMFADKAVDVVGAAAKERIVSMPHDLDAVIFQIRLHLIPHAVQGRGKAHHLRTHRLPPYSSSRLCCWPPSIPLGGRATRPPLPPLAVLRP